MMPYIIMLVLVASVWIPVATEAAKNDKISYLLAFTILFLFMGLRATTVGTDTSNYVNLYVYAGQQSLASSFQVIESAPLYNLYSWVLYQITHEDQAILILNSMFICIGYGVFFYRFSENRLLSIVIFIGSYAYFGCMNAMRQNVATAFLLLAVVFFFEKKRIISLVLAVCSIAIHNTVAVAVILLAVAYVTSRRIKVVSMKTVAAVFLGCVVGSLLSGLLIEFFVSYFPRYSRYLLDTASVGISSINGGRTQILWMIYLAGVLLFSSVSAVRLQLNSDQTIRFIFVASVIAVSFGSLMGDYRLIMRCVSYLMPFLICFLSTASEATDKESHTLITRLGLIAAFTLIGAAYLLGNYSDVLPYEFCLTR